MSDRFPESAPVHQLYGRNNPPSGVFGSCSMRLDRFPACETASANQIHYDIVQCIDKPLIDFLYKECHRFFKKRFSLWSSSFSFFSLRISFMLL